MTVAFLSNVSFLKKPFLLRVKLASSRLLVTLPTTFMSSGNVCFFVLYFHPLRTFCCCLYIFSNLLRYSGIILNEYHRLQRIFSFDSRPLAIRCCFCPAPRVRRYAFFSTFISIQGTEIGGMIIVLAAVNSPLSRRPPLTTTMMVGLLLWFEKCNCLLGLLLLHLLLLNTQSHLTLSLIQYLCL